MGSGPTFEWTSDRDRQLREMLADRQSARAIAKAFGVNNMTVNRRIKKLGLAEAEQSEKANALHIQRYKAARRGFDVPPQLEATYYELLKSGVPIAEACRRLGIDGKAQKRGA